LKNLDLTNFPKSNLSDWEDAAEKQLKKENPMKNLSWESHGLNALKPFYDISDFRGISSYISFFQNLPSHRWKLYETITVKSEKEANGKAIEALLGGCDGVIFRMESKIDPEQLMKGIDKSICDVSIMGESYQQGSNHMNKENTVKELQPSTSPFDQISDILQNISDKRFVYRHAFMDFFLEIASIRALRYFLLEERKLTDVKIHSQISLNKNSEYQWFFNTTAGLASILGGSHSISMPTATGDSRITRNVGNLIRDESKIEIYSDQCGGSYYVESLTAKIIDLVKAEIK